MKLYFVRHAETQENIDHILSGHSSVPLTDKGKKQAFDLALEISKSCSRIYSSDLIRCKQTAEIINQKLNLPLIYDVRLREINTGALTGQYTKDIDQKIRQEIKTSEYDIRLYGGESSEDVKKRILDFIKDIQEKHSKEEILVVTSSGIIRLMHYLFNNIVHEIIQNDSVHEFEFKD